MNNWIENEMESNSNPIPYFRINLIRKIQDNCERKESISIYYMSMKKTNVDTNNTGQILKTMLMKRSKN